MFHFKGVSGDGEIVYREKQPDGIFFSANRRTDDLLEKYVGLGGFFVSREPGEIRRIDCCPSGNPRGREQSHALLKKWVDEIRGTAESETTGD
jgi:hypothetical protein